MISRTGWRIDDVYRIVIRNCHSELSTSKCSHRHIYECSTHLEILGPGDAGDDEVHLSWFPLGAEIVVNVEMANEHCASGNRDVWKTRENVPVIDAKEIAQVM